MSVSVFRSSCSYAGRVLAVVSSIMLFTAMAQAAQITLAWDKVDGSSVAGYKLYYGTQSAKYTSTVNVGNTLQETISDLDYDTIYYFAAKTYDSAGNESDYSNEVSGRIPFPNSAPETPVLYLGSSTSPINSSYSCTASATDPDGDALQYRMSWGDGSVSDWGGATQSHSWSTAGEYCIKSQAQDSSGAPSSWSGCYSVTVNLPVETPPGDVTPGGDTGTHGVVKYWFEAEDGDIAVPMEIAYDEQASENGFIRTPNGTGNRYKPAADSGWASYRIDVPVAGNYLIWGRVFSPTYEDDSFFVSVDDGSYGRWNTQVASDWVWDAVSSQGGGDPMVYYLTEGSHTITVLQREDGTQIDRLLVTNDPDYLPQDLGEILESNLTQIWLESEGGTVVSPMQIQTDSTASGAAFVGVPDIGENHSRPDLGAGYVDFGFEVPRSGDYIIWGRVLAPSYSDDSFFVSVDDAAYIRWNPQVGDAWHWEVVNFGSSGTPLVKYLKAGWHTLTLLCREDGTTIDKILITNDAAYTPQGQGGDSSGSIPSGKTITIEAEKGVIDGVMTLAADADASGGQSIWVPEGTGNAYDPDSQSGSAAYFFSVPESGDYVVWGRVFSSNYSNDSFWVAIDGETPFRWNTQVASSWTWDQAAANGSTGPMIWHLSAGLHTLVLMQREDGTMLDKVVITSDLDTIPN